MKVSKAVLTLLVVSLLVGTGLIAGTAYAQDDDPPADPTYPFPGRGHGPRAEKGMMLADGDHPLHDYIVEAYAEAFGLSVTDLESKLDAGETMMDIALAAGLTEEEAWTLMRDARQSALEAAQADGIELPAPGPRGDDGKLLADVDNPLHEYIMEAYAEALGISVADLESKLDAGDTMMDIALAAGLTQAEAWMLMHDARQSALEAALADGIELPAQGPRGVGVGPSGKGDCLMDGSEAGARGMRGLRSNAPGIDQ